MKSFITFIKIAGLVLICLLISFLVVWPLWKFATSAPVIYSFCVLGILLALLIFVIVRKILKKHAK